MAVLKHLSSKSADYTKAMEYLMFQHNEQTQKPILDENGRKILREEFYLDGLNCNPNSFDKECQQLNARYHKNQKYSEVKSHHYILSFDPRDATEAGLTGKRAQLLGLEFAKRFFPGHQALVCTHMDGHNGSGNIHVHIVINSLRKLDVEQQDFMERPCDSRAGYKHHQTREYLTAMQQGIMEIAEREHLHQIDLFTPAKSKIMDKEYRAKQRGQRKLDELNEQIVAAKLKPRTTIFQTQKQFLRDAIKDIASQAKSPEEFRELLKEKYGVEVKDRRGRYSYLHPDRNKFITSRALGSDFEKEHLEQLFRENIFREDAQEETQRETYDPSYDYHADPMAILYVRSHLRLVVDLQNNIKAKQSAAYARKVKISNLKEMARTIVYIQEHGYDTREDLQRHQMQISEKKAKVQAALSKTDAQIKETNAQIHFTGQYYATRQVQRQFLKTHFKKKYREEHREELDKYNEATAFFQTHCSGKVPSMKNLKVKKEKLLALQSEQHKELSGFDQMERELQTASANVESILRTDNTPNVRRSRNQPGL